MTPLDAWLLVVLIDSLGAPLAWLGAEAKPWHYWMAPGIAGIVVLATILMALGYVVRVVLARYGIRLGRR